MSILQILDKPNYPKNICYVCFYKLEMWSDFKSQFLKTHKTIVTHFKVVDNQVRNYYKILMSTYTVTCIFICICVCRHLTKKR